MAAHDVPSRYNWQPLFASDVPLLHAPRFMPVATGKTHEELQLDGALQAPKEPDRRTLCSQYLGKMTAAGYMG